MSRTTVSRLIWGTNRDEAVARFVTRHSGAIVYRHKRHPLVAVVSRASGRPIYAVWAGNSAKPCAYYSARTLEAAFSYAEEKWKACAAGFAAKAKRREEEAAKRAALKASDHFTVGDVIVNTWGYDQTNVDFYAVTAVGSRSIKLRRLAAKRAETSFLAGICQPDRYNYTGDEFTKNLSAYGELSFEFGGSHKWTGKAEHWSAYA